MLRPKFKTDYKILFYILEELYRKKSKKRKIFYLISLTRRMNKWRYYWYISLFSDLMYYPIIKFSYHLLYCGEYMGKKSNKRKIFFSLVPIL